MGTGELVEAEVSGGLITAVRPLLGEPAESFPSDIWLLPGFVDVQVNGFAGEDFNGPEVSSDGITKAVQSLWREGVTQICPTITTDSAENMLNSLRAIVTACEDARVSASIPCIHMEGPFISPEDGSRGAHPKEHVRLPDWKELETWQEVTGGRIGIVTLAPEVEGGVEFVVQLANAGIVPGIGHTAASPEVIRQAAAAGARLSTHLGNGAHAVLPRHPNYIWEQAAADELWASVILDGHHLPPAVAKCLIRSKQVERTVLISDAVSVAGLPPGRYRTLAMEVEVLPNRRCSLLGTPYLAGSVIDVRTGVGNAVKFAGVGAAQAVQMATLNPARLLGLEQRLGRIAAGQEASMTVCRWQPHVSEIEVLLTVVAGQVVYEASHRPAADIKL